LEELNMSMGFYMKSKNQSYLAFPLNDK